MRRLPILLYPLLLFILIQSCVSIYRNVKTNLDNEYKEGLDAFKGGNYEKAAEHFHYIEEIDPDFRNVQRYVALTEGEGNRHIISLYNDGVKLQARKKEVDALRRFREVEVIRKDFKDIKLRIDELEKSETVKKETKGLIAKGEKEEQNHNNLKARYFYNEVLKYDPDNGDAKNHKKRVQKELTKKAEGIFIDAENKFKNKQYSKAALLYKEALENDPDHKQSKEHLKETEILLANILNYDRGLEYFKRKRYLEAYISLSNVNGEYKDSNAYKNKARIEAVGNISTYVEEAKNLYNENKLKESIVIFDKILAVDPLQDEAKKYKTQAEKKLETMKSFD